jgi:predicted enzyme related to lactoylglutathione lyase
MAVDSIEESLDRVTANGGTVLQGKAPIPGIGWFATCRDSEGNVFGLFKEDAAARMG